jgi:hypothetical protein
MAKNTFIGTGGSADWTNTGNWSSGAAPVSTQDLYLTANSNSLTTGLAQSAVLPASLNVFTDYTGSIGNSGTVSGSSGSYLQLGPTVVNIGVQGQGTGNGPRRFNLNTGSTTTTINVISTTSSALDSGQAPVRLLGTSMTINQTGGIISVAAFPTETATITALNIANGGTGVSPQAFIGAGATLTALSQNAGTVTTASTASVPNATVSRSSTINHIGTGGFGTLTIGTGSTCNYDGSGTVDLLQLYGTIDLSGGGGTVTLTDSTFYTGAKVIDPLGRLVFTNPPTLSGCSQKDLTIDLGQGRKW